MKKILFQIFLTGAIQSSLYGQSYCNNFQVNTVQIDSIQPNTLQVNISFNANASLFANYPYIAQLTDCQGNLVGIGNNFWFGQFGQSTQDYPVSFNGTMPCEPYSISFVYSDNSGVTDTCELTYSSTNGLVNLEQEFLLIAPNPSTSSVTITVGKQFMDSEIKLIDLNGKIVLSSQMESFQKILSLENLNKGTYQIVIENQGDRTYKKLVVN